MPTALFTCTRCGTESSPGMRFCTHCGAAVGAAATAQPQAQQSAFAQPQAQPIAPPPFAQQPAFAPPQAQPFAQQPIAQPFGQQPFAQPQAQPFAQPPIARPPHEAQPVQPSTRVAAARLVSILKDGSDGPAFPLDREQIDIGRTEGDILLPDDPYLSPRHARIRRKGDGFFVRDLESVNGVYVRIVEPVELRDGDRILIGQQLLRFEVLADLESPLGPAAVQGVLVFGTPEVPRIARLVQYTTEGVGRDLHYLYRGETILGRENGDIVFTDDPFLSRRHASITVERTTRRFLLTDMGSSNGTALRIHGERTLAAGDQIRVGKHLFRLDVEGVALGGRPAR